MKRTGLRVVLYVVGGLFCLALPAMVVPESWLREMAAWFADPELVDALWPAGPAIDYMIRASMVFYLWVGVILLLAARNPEQHRTQIDIAIGGLLLLAVVTLSTGVMNDLPYFWFLGDAISSAVGGILLLVLRPGAASSG